ncbi:MAG: aldehyde ferredoxin oxidoreductase family protein [Chloroflexi bacterium]|nr:aldehyde ferredoxin oxidoreductase family protein [Chloroflexota bacterium]
MPKPAWIWKTLRVNLRSRTWAVEEKPEEWTRQFLGGRAFGAYHLVQEVPDRADPLGPENKLILATGVLTYTKLSGASRFSAVAKSPLTGGYGESEAGGWWGPELVAAGFNAIILEDQADTPVYLLIKDGQVEIRDARPIWGLANREAYRWIQDQAGRCRVLQIGPAGENLVRYACLINELRHINGRGGMGAVMGSKNLKAIAVRGSANPKVLNPEAFAPLREWHNHYLLTSFYGKYFRQHGTNSGTEYQNVMGALPTRNFNEMTFDEIDQISAAAFEAEAIKSRGTCYGCVLRCKPLVSLAGDLQVDPALGGPEYETVAALGSLCGISDRRAIAKGNALAADLGLDAISLGSCLAFAMECYEAGLITPQESGGVELRFGNAEAMLALIEDIAFRRGLGSLLAEGVARAARTLGRGAEAFALHVKGQEFPMHDPRTKYAQALAYAVSPTGAEHNTTPSDEMFSKKGEFFKQIMPLGIEKPVPETSLEADKVRLYTYLHHERSLYNSLLICLHVVDPVTPFNLNKLVEIVLAVTGWEVSSWELMKVGERGTTLARLFNIRQGFTAADDRLPEKMFVEIKSGPKAGRVVDPGGAPIAIQLYYGMMGWDAGGVPTLAKLAELGLSEVIRSPF